MYCPSFPEAPTMHTLISSSHQLTGTQIWPAFRARHEKENAGVTEAQQGRPQCSGVREGLRAAARVYPVPSGAAAVVRSGQRLGDDTASEADRPGLADAWRRMRPGEGCSG